MSDFPAAHSMDTTWFAIDRDGHVAMFESGESGCVPEDAYLGDDHDEVTDLVHDLPPTGAVHDLAGRRAAAGADHVDLAYLGDGSEVIVFVRDLAPLRDLLARIEATELAATSGAALQVRALDRAALEELHAREACLGCFLFFEDERGELAAHGVYRYGHTCDNWIAGPYAREAIPASPIHCDALPALTEAVRYPGRFADTPELQPAELWPCQSWGPSWLASDRRTVRPFEGRESEHAEQVEGARGVDPDLVFLDAPLATSAAPPVEPTMAPRKPWWKFW
jgi:hypothetical protein